MGEKTTRTQAIQVCTEVLKEAAKNNRLTWIYQQPTGEWMWTSNAFRAHGISGEQLFCVQGRPEASKFEDGAALATFINDVNGWELFDG